jgi:hypothetical protein
MTNINRWAWLAGAWWMAGLALLAQPVEPAPSPVARVNLGMTQEQVREILGNPTTKARQILFREHVEVWSYSRESAVVEFRCLKGQRPTVVNVHRTDPAKR